MFSISIASYLPLLHCFLSPSSYSLSPSQPFYLFPYLLVSAYLLICSLSPLFYSCILYSLKAHPYHHYLAPLSPFHHSPSNSTASLPAFLPFMPLPYLPPITQLHLLSLLPSSPIPVPFCIIPLPPTIPHPQYLICSLSPHSRRCSGQFHREADPPAGEGRHHH